MGDGRLRRDGARAEGARRAALAGALSTVLVTGAASGIGAATTEVLRAQGYDVLAVDLADGDLATAEGRRAVVDLCPPQLAGAVLCAGLVGLTGRPSSLLASVNYFGAVEVAEALRPRFTDPASVVVLSSNSVTIQPGWDPDLVDACLSGDEPLARQVAERRDSPTAYPATKAALARWVRRNAPAWAADGIRLNAVAPGLVETPLSEQVRADPNLAPLMAALPVPLGRGAEPHEIAELLAFLVGPAGRFFCGSVLLCDGGTEALLRPDDWPARWR